MLVHSHQGVYDECYEAQIVFRSLAWSVEKDACVSAERPVVVLARSVDALKWLFMKENSESVVACHATHEVHDEHVVVYGEVAFFKYWSQLKLVWRHFVVSCLYRYSKLEGLNLKVLHECSHT